LRDKLCDELRHAAALAVVANSEDFLDFNEPYRVPFGHLFSFLRRQYFY
jgi:hypothetical protein